MQSKRILGSITLTAALAFASLVHGQSAYFQTVTNLNPVGYWPLNETTPPPPPFAFNNVATNLGSLGAQANAHYGAWYQPSNTTWYLTNNIVQAPAVTAPFDSSVGMLCQGVPGQYVILPRTANGVFNNNLTLTPPFSIEAWVNMGSISKGLLDIVSEGGYVTVNYGGANTNDPFYGGPGLGFAGVELGTYQNFILFACNGTNAESKSHELDGTKNLTVGSWYHIVATFDGTTEQLWVNGVSEGTRNIISQDNHPYVPHPSAPLIMGGGGEPAASYGNDLIGTIDDVAIYNEVLPQASILNHYQTAYGTNATYGSVYTNAVMADNPTFYYRLNDAVTVTNAGYPANTFPVATNYGTLGASGNGLYQPGTKPGAAGPAYVGFGGSSASVAINGWFGGVDVGGGNLPAALNPTNTSPLTLVTWFRGNIADAPARFQEMVGHGDSSYRLSLGQVAGENHFNPGPGPEVQFTSATQVANAGFALNDGNWHMAVGVDDGTNEYLYLDGVLALSSNNAAGINIAGNTNDLLIGGDSEYTYASWGSANTIRAFDGQVAHVAFWTNALSAAQIQAMFDAAGVPPSIFVQPVATTNNVGAALSVPVTVRGSQPISYQWYNTNTGAVSGQTSSNLFFSAVTTNADGFYYVVATSSYGSVTSSVAEVYVFGRAAVVSESSTNDQVYVGENPVLSVVTSGGQPITYQWYSNSVAVTSATNSAYVISNAQTTASYTVNVSNSLGSLLDGPFNVTVVPDPTAPYPLQVLADHPLAFWRLDETNGTTAYDYVSGFNGTYTNVQLGYLPGSQGYAPESDPNEQAAGFATLFGVTNNSYVGDIPTNVNFAAPTNVNGEFSVEAWIQANFVVDDSGILALGYGNGGEEFAMDLGATGHDLRFYAREASGNSVNDSSDFAPTSDAAWHYVVGVCDEANSNLTFYLDGSNVVQNPMPAKSGILTSLMSMTIGARQEALGSQYDDQFFGGISQVAVYKYPLTAAQVKAHYFASGIPATVTVIPSTQTTNQGENATFTAVGNGTATLSYQWLDPNGTPISTNSTLIISNVQPSAGGQYTVIVTNLYGSATGYAQLYVASGPPQIVQDISPLSQTVPLYSGLDTISYTVGVSGVAPFAFQWYQNGNPVSGATNATYTFTAVAGTNTYYVTITNADTGAGSPAQSGTATVIGVPAPQLAATNYAYRAKITFPGYTGTPETNFPALITLSPSTLAGLEYSQFASNGADVQFTDSTGSNILAHEVDEWNVGGVSTLWVNIPLLNGSPIWVYWGNSNYSNVSSLAASNVWTDAGYQIVYHLKETNFPYADSTGKYPAIDGVATTQTTGVVGHGQEFDGATTYLSPGLVTLSNQFTTYAWVYDDTGYQIRTVWANAHGGYGGNGFSEFINAYNSSDAGILIASGDEPVGSTGDQPEFTGAFTSNQWHLFTVAFNQPAAACDIYLDGAFIGSGPAVSDFVLTTNLNLGAFLDPVFFWQGTMDEARIQYGVATTNWIHTTYENMANSSYVAYSSVNLEPELYITASSGNDTFSWSTNNGTFVLESSTNLNQPAWTQITSPAPTVVGGFYEQTIPATNSGSYFYRLQGQ